MPPGGEKTEKATPKKRRDERKKGNVFLSKDAIAVVTLFSTFLALKLLAGGIAEDINDFFRLCLQYSQEVPTGQAYPLFSQVFQAGVLVFFKRAGPILGISIIAAVAATFFQTKMLATPEALKPKLNRISPLQGFKKLFSLKSIVDALKGILKIAVLLVIIYYFLERMMIHFFNYLNTELGYACSHLFQSSMTMVFEILVAFTILAGFDFYFQWWDYERKLKMSKQEVKEEYKQVEGDPKIKAKIKETQRKMAQSRMMQKVPGADVVIRNPEHVAVALRYKPDIDNAPIVLAMGLDSLALRIVKVAEENHVPTIENVTLARTLFAECELDREIPPALYGMVADVLVYLYRLDAEERKT